MAELIITKKLNGDLAAILPEDLAQLPTDFRNYLAKQASLSEPQTTKLAEIQAENEKLKQQILTLNSPEHLKSQLANLAEDAYLELGQELGFLEVVDEAKTPAAEDSQPAGPQTVTAAESPAPAAGPGPRAFKLIKSPGKILRIFRSK